MTTLLRLVRSQGARNGLTFLASKDVKVYNVACRSVSSTAKKDETASDMPYTTNTWVSYGFYTHDKKLDRHFMHLSLFCGISLLLVGGAFILAYLPDPQLRDWAQREAYLQLRYREEHGLPLVDPNLIDPSKFTLPSEEELKNVELII